MKILTVKRVIYGRKETPVELREYRLTSGGPVGNIDDWKDIAKKNGYNKVMFIEKDGETFSQFVFDDDRSQK